MSTRLSWGYLGVISSLSRRLHVTQDQRVPARRAGRRGQGGRDPGVGGVPAGARRCRRSGDGRRTPGRPDAGRRPLEELHQARVRRARRRQRSAQDSGAEPTSVDLVAALVESGGLALVVLESADIDPQDLADELRARQARDGGAARMEGVAERAVEQARGAGHSYVGTEHLLLGLTAGPTRELARAT